MAITHVNGFGTIPVSGDYISLGPAPANGASTWSRQPGRGPGGYALRHTNSLSSSSNYYVNYFTVPVNTNDFSLAFAMNHTSAGTSGSGGDNCGVNFNGSSSTGVNLGVNAINSYSPGSSTSAFTVYNNTPNGVGWHWWNFIHKGHATAGSLKVYRDGVLLAEQLPDTMQLTPVTRCLVYMGNYFGGLAVEVADLILRDDLNIIPDSRVDTLFPDATLVGAWTAWDAGSVGNNHLAVNENPTMNAATYVGAATVGTLDTYGLTNLQSTAASVTTVQVSARATKSDAGAKTMQVLANANAGTAVDPGGGGTVYGKFDLDGASAWTTATVNSMTAGIKVVT